MKELILHLDPVFAFYEMATQDTTKTSAPPGQAVTVELFQELFVKLVKAAQNLETEESGSNETTAKFMQSETTIKKPASIEAYKVVSEMFVSQL